MYNINFHNKIAQLSLSHYENLPKKGKPTAHEWTILSTIIKYSKGEDKFEVVALGTGTKSIGYTKMSKLGDILNDSHAEVICRRAFLKYLYSELISALDKKGNTFLFNNIANKFSINNDISFHFFTTHVPCGDASIFPKNEITEKRKLSDDEYDSCKRSKQECDDIHRTGAKCLPEDKNNQDLKKSGLDYHVVGVVRTKPGRGDTSLSASCSDKLSRWCHVGIQGALINLLIEKELKLATFTIVGTTKCNETALIRALYTRLRSSSTDIIPETSRIATGQSENTFLYQKNSERTRPCPSSIIWSNVTEKPLEVAVEGHKQGITKKKLTSKTGRLSICRRELFSQFLNVLKKMEEVGVVPQYKFEEMKSLNLNEVKALSVDYQRKWNKLKSDGFKYWTSKDNIFGEFLITDDS